MTKAEQYIQDYTRNCSNELCYEEGLGKLYEPWLTPDQARCVAELAKEEMIEKACKWLEENKDHPLIGCEDPCLSGYLTSFFIEDFRKAMKGE